MKLPGPVRQELDGIIVMAYDTAGLKAVMKYGLSENLEGLCNINQPLEALVLDLINWLESNDQLIGFLRYVTRDRPQNQPLRDLCMNHAPDALKSELPQVPESEVRQSLDSLRATFRPDAPNEAEIFVTESRVCAEHLKEDAGRLVGYKTLHDNLQLLDLTLQSILLLQPSLNGDPRVWGQLNKRAQLIRQFHDRAMALTAVPLILQSEGDWINRLGNDVTVLCEARDHTSLPQVTSSIESLRELRSESVRINAIIGFSVRSLRIRGLVERLSPLAEQPANAAERNDLIAATLTSLRRSEPLFAGLMRQHDDWQQIEVALRTGEEQIDPWAKRHLWNWKRVGPMLRELCAGDAHAQWSIDLLSAMTQWEAAGAANRQNDASRTFNSMRAGSTHRFKTVDAELLNMSNSLLGTATALRAALQ